MNISVPVFIVWLRNDLRLADNPALHDAVMQAQRTGARILPLYLVEEPSSLGEASCWWLKASLSRLQEDLSRVGAPLLICRGASHVILPALAHEVGAQAVFWNRRHDPLGKAADRIVEEILAAQSVAVHTFNAALLFDPGQVLTQGGSPFQVFTPFWRSCMSKMALDPLSPPLEAPDHVPGMALPLEGLSPDAALPEAQSRELAGFWTPGEAAAFERLSQFIERDLASYHIGRDRPDLSATSRLSPHLHFGEISPRQIWAAMPHGTGEGQEAFWREIGWREFAYHLLYHFPLLTDQPMKAAFAGFSWSADQGALEAWQQGKTGFPIIDAAMRCLLQTGWIHNRARMIAASFLVKDLLIPWQQGQAWFDAYLVDADVACNGVGWQWVSGCGADGAPYFRVFNPVLQGKKFDPQGRFTRRWVPELKALPDRFLHCPWEAPAGVLKEAGVALGRNYPSPIVDHAIARQRALDAYASMSQVRYDEGESSS